jgi:hypothetical protein
MKVSELKKGMLLEGIGTARLHVLPSSVTWGPGFPLLQTVWPSKHDKNKKFTKCAMYLGTREELGFDKNFWGRRYALVNGQTMIIDREAWKYIQPIKEKKNGNII